MIRAEFPLLLLIVSLLFCPGASADKCAHLYALSEAQLSGLKPEFLAKHNNHYSLELPVTAVKNQCDYGSCWIYGTTANVEAEFLRRTGRNVAISEPFLILRSLEERIGKALANPGGHLGEGGRFESAQFLIGKYGAVPASVWKPRVPFEEGQNLRRLLTFLEHRIAQYHWDLAKHKSSRKKLLKNARQDIADILHAYTGEVPESFSFDGMAFSGPKEFGRFVEPNAGKAVRVYTMRKGGLPRKLEAAATNGSEDANKYFDDTVPTAYTPASREEMNKIVVEALRSGHTVSVSTEMNRAFIDRGTGIMSIEAVPLPKEFRLAPSQYREKFGIQSGHHQMAIVGADLDANGHVIKYKIKNSWGEKSGDSGFYHMYPDYFDAFVTSITVP